MMTSSIGNISALLALAAASYYLIQCWCTVYPKKYAHGFVVPCFVVVMQSFIMSSHQLFIHIHQGCFDGTGAIVKLPQCQWSKPDGYGKISQCITTTKHSKAKSVCIFLGIYCIFKGAMRHLAESNSPWSGPEINPPKKLGIHIFIIAAPSACDLLKYIQLSPLTYIWVLCGKILEVTAQSTNWM